MRFNICNIAEIACSQAFLKIKHKKFENSINMSFIFFQRITLRSFLIVNQAKNIAANASPVPAKVPANLSNSILTTSLLSEN